jgi:hypothetical protein
MMARKLGQVTQGSGESVAYKVDFALWGTPSSPTQKLTDLTDNSDQASKITGSATVNSTTVTTGLVANLVPGRTYRLTVGATIGSNTLSAFLEITGE